MHTLVYNTGALGDFITTLPALRAYRRRYDPGARFTLLGKPEHGQLGIATQDLHGLLDVEEARFATLFAEQPRFDRIPELAAVASAIVYATSGSPILRNLRRLSLKALYHQLPFPSHQAAPVHVVDFHLSLFEPDALHGTQTAPSLMIRASQSGPAQTITDKANQSFAVIHAGSGSRSKNWPLSCFVEVACSLRASGLEVIWSAGPAERNMDIPSEERLVTGLPLVELARLLSRADLYVGNDSGISHLAAAVGCPSVVVFGPTSTEAWAPRGQHVRVIRAPGGVLTDLPPSCVRDACMTAVTNCPLTLHQRKT
jgi:heptosyltransferase III